MTFAVGSMLCQYDALPQKLAVRRVATTTATPDDVENYPTVELLDDGEGTCVESEEFNHVFKIVLVGDSGVGKSNLLSRFVRNVFNEEQRATIGVDMMVRHARIHGQGGPVVVKLQIWDSAGQERFRAMSSVFYRNAMAAVVVYDITDKKSFANMPTWLAEVRKYSEDSTVLLLGNKSDLAHIRVVSTDSGRDFAAGHDLLFHETSAFDRTNVQPAFINMIKQAFIRFERQQKEASQAVAVADEQQGDEEEVVNDGDEDGTCHDGNGDESAPAAARVVAEPLLKLKKKKKKKGIIVLDDDDDDDDEGTTGKRRRRKRHRPGCCKKS